MKINDLIKLLGEGYINNSEHFVGNCPFCGKEDHFYLNTIKIFQKDSNGLYKKAFDCKKCGEVGDLKKLLKHFNKLHLLKGEVVDTKILKKKLKSEVNTEEKIDLEITNKKLPSGFKRIFDDEYLNKRGFTSNEYEKYQIGVSNTLFKYENYIIIAIIQNGECKGHIARSKLGKEEIKKINEEYKSLGLKKKYLRYQNSISDFSKMLFGLDEIGYLTKTIILVEGLFDKIRVDQALNLDLSPEIKCCSTFGKSISKAQIKLLCERKIENIILIQDPDAIDDSKNYASILSKNFNVSLGFTGKKDLGDSTTKEIHSIIKNLKTVENYYSGMVLKKELV